MSFLRQAWPKKAVKNKADHSARLQAVITSVRAGELTVARGARELGCVRKTLAERVWHETKRDVLARDRMCVICLRTDCLDVHHRIPRGSGGTSRPEIAYGWANLITLCRGHHSYAEEHADWAAERGLCLERFHTPPLEQVSYCGEWALLGDDGSVRFIPYRGKERL